jgi:hypothetical protein
MSATSKATAAEIMLPMNMEVAVNSLLPLPPALKTILYLPCFCQSNVKLFLILNKFQSTLLCDTFPKITPAYHPNLMLRTCPTSVGK